MNRKVLAILGAVGALVGMSAGLFFAQDEEGGQVPPGPHKTAAACPAQTEALKGADIHVDFYIPDCPSAADIHGLVTPHWNPDIVALCEEHIAQGDAPGLCREYVEHAQRYGYGDAEAAP